MHFKLLVPAIFALVSLLSCAPESAAGEPSSTAAPKSTSLTPLAVVNERMAAYNRHDLTAFMATYAEGVEVYTYPDVLLGKGKPHLQSLFEPMLAAGSVQVEIHHQIAKDSFVINHETVTDGKSETEYVSIYEVHQGRIQSVRFVRD